MKFFNLKRMTVLLSIVLALTPVLSVQAASPVSGGAVFQNLSSQDDEMCKRPREFRAARSFKISHLRMILM